MKKLIALLTLTISIGAIAQERVKLESSHANVTSSQAVLVRTANTPDVVTVTFQVPMSKSVCQRYETRYVMVTSGMQCGYIERITGYTTQSYCVRHNPGNGQCLRYETRRIPVIQRYPRTCQVPETYCASYGTVTNFESDHVKIKFKDLPHLGGSEEDTFLVKAFQRSFGAINIDYSIVPMQTVIPYEVKSKGIFGADVYVIKVK